MTVESDPAVSIAILSGAMNLSEKTLTLGYMAGSVPMPDSIIRDVCNRAKVRGWRMSTLRAWDPVIAARCAAMLTALKTVPLDAA